MALQHYILTVLVVCAVLRVKAAIPRVHVQTTNSALPVVIWHGMGDSCCSSRSIGSIKTLIEQKLGVYVLSIATGATESSDVWSSYFGDVNAQVAQACQQIRATPELRGGYDAIGFSQGGQFLRALVQRCQHLGPKARLLITMGAQHQGVMTIPGCNFATSHPKLSSEASNLALEAGFESSAACQAMQALLSRGAYLPFVQSRVVQAQYFKDPYNLEQYMAHNIFLPDLNNEREDKIGQYKSNLLSLDKFVMYRFAEDTTVVPRDSSWFSFFDGTALQPLSEQALYKEDWLGLRQLEESGRLVYAEAPGRHMHFTMEWFEREIIDGYLRQAGFAA